MNFTREPIVETVITPREGCKLVIRCSKANGGEDYFVDAVEVVSFGHSFFFRSLERPKSFLVPVSDYEVLELKETRMVLKNVSGDKAIKIGGGKAKEDATLSESRPAPEREPRKRSKSRRGRRTRERVQEKDKGKKVEESSDLPQSAEENPSEVEALVTEEKKQEDLIEKKEAVKPEEGIEEAPSFISKLFPPPPTLIKESLSKYKPAESEEREESIVEEPEGKKEVDETIYEEPIQQPEKEDENEQ